MSSTTALKPQKYKHWVSILIPMYNEGKTIVFVLNKVKKAMADKSYEIIVIDDGSKDNSAEEVEKFMAINPDLNIQYIHQNNKGKGGAVRTGISKAEGEILVIQDADMEYKPADILPLLTPFIEGAKVVYGSRNMHEGKRDHSSIFFYWGGLFVTHVTNWLFGSKLTDEATGYKLFHASLFETMKFKYNDFAWEPELTAKILKENIEIIELPISYKPRSKSDGKKISWKDGVKAIWVLIVERFRP